MWATHPASGACSRHRPHAAEPVWPSRPLCSACAASPGRLQQAATGEAQHARLAAAAPVAVTLPSGLRLARALECGWHPACPALWPHLLAAGADTSLSCDVPEEQHARATQAGAGRLHEQGDSSGRGCLCGNTPGCSRFLAADVTRVPSYQGPFSVAHLLFPSLSVPKDLAEALAKAALLVAPGGHLVLGAPTGRAAADELAQRNRETGVQLWRLPEEASALAALISPLPLTLVSLIDEPDFYAAVLQIPPLYCLPHGPLRLEAPVVRGFGRGSAAMGIPTANMEPETCVQQAAAQAPFATPRALRRGVYYGWARVVGDGSSSAGGVHGGVVKAVVNVGKRPTFADGSGDTVEVHLMHSYGAQFYGATLRVVLLGFMRPELSFEGVPALVARIRTDIGSAAALLDVGGNKEAARDAWLTA